MIATSAADVTGTLGAIVLVIGAVGALFWKVFSWMASESKRHDDAREIESKRHDAALDAQRRQFTTFLGNHMSGNTRALKDILEQLEQLTQEVRSGR